MKKKIIFEGVGTALITPFNCGEIDYPTLGKIIDEQIEAGIECLVVGGTTGEAATLKDNERYELFSFAKERIGGRTKLVLGVGTNDTEKAAAHVKYSRKLGADGLLAVTPYYNKGTKEGLIRHFEKLASLSDIPIILYNVPSRTGVNLEMDMLSRLAKNELIVGIKEASNDADRLVSLSAFGDELWLYAGNDSQIYTVLSLGGLGVISVLSNPYPQKTREICKQFFANNKTKSLQLQQRAIPVLNSLFIETNPAPVKHLMMLKGKCKEDLRLPLYNVSTNSAEVIKKCAEEYENN